ncbi:MAG: response regulator [Campylobacterales bacterium]|nr:response regulator [Campylobacterales bacterium]
MHLLIVEDEHSVADQLKQLLEKEKYTCDVAYSYRDALELIDEKRFDLVLLDWNLPDGDGLSPLTLMRDEGINSCLIEVKLHLGLELAKF